MLSKSATRQLLVFSAASVFSLSAVMPQSAEAKKGFGFGVGVGVGLGAAVLLNEAAKAMQGKPQPSSRPRSSTNPGGRKGGGDDNDSASSAADGQLTARSQAESSRKLAKAQEELAEFERNMKIEKARNVGLAISGFIGELRDLHKSLLGNSRANVSAASGNDINQVTAGQVQSAVEKAYIDGQLQDFDRFAGELWTRDRLMVRILHVAEEGLAPYFNGVGSRGPSMDDLASLFARSARSVYAEAREVGEIVGVSHSFDRFIRTIYEQASDVPEGLWTTGADGHYERLVSSVIDGIPRERFVASDATLVSDPLGLEKQFQFRFRARRALYDCLAANYGNLASGKMIDASVSSAVAVPGSPGAVLDMPETAGPNSAPTRLAASATGNATAANSDTLDIWRRAQVYVRDVCSAPVTDVADSANSQSLRPVPARFDSARSGFGSPLRTLPAGLR